MDKNIEALMARIVNGEDPEAIGKEFTEALNKAVKEKNSKSEREKKMSEYADRMAEDLIGYVRLSEPRVSEEALAMINGKFIKSVFDQHLKNMKNIIDLQETLGSHLPKTTEKPCQDPEAIINNFLKRNGLL